ncbi:signal recognition particle protein, partial [Listeria monocytogenes]
DTEKMKAMEQKMKDNSMTLDDFLEQLQQVKQMGPLDELLKMMPGANKMKGLDNMNVDDKQLGHIEAIIKSMTKNEKDNPDIINASRRKRIARGSGRPVQEINRLLKQFAEMKKMMKQMTGGGKGKKGKNPFGNFKMPF